METISHSPILVDQAYEALVAAIASGQLQPGERIRQADLARELGVSRQPISHALLLLKHQGLVQDAGRRGLEVAPVDPGRIAGLYQVRAVIDALAGRLAAERVAAGEVGKDDKDALRQAVIAGKELARGADIPALIAADVAFHKLVYRLAGNPAIGDTIEPQFPHLMRSMTPSLNDWELRERWWAEHELIAREILAGTPTEASDAARRHAESAGAETMMRLDSPVPADDSPAAQSEDDVSSDDDLPEDMEENGPDTALGAAAATD